MDDARNLGTPRGESPMPLSRRELRQRREAAAIAGASGARVDQATDAAEQPQAPHSADSVAAAAPADHATPDEPTTPPGGVSFGSLAGMFAAAAEESSPQPTVLTVCTGNICRSPLAESLLRTRLAGRDLRVHCVRRREQRLTGLREHELVRASSPQEERSAQSALER